MATVAFGLKREHEAAKAVWKMRHVAGIRGNRMTA